MYFNILEQFGVPIGTPFAFLTRNYIEINGSRIKGQFAVKKKPNRT